MRLAIFSDVHANLPALEAVLDDIDRQSPDVVYCLGDLVGYNTWPNEVVDLVRQRRIPTLAGNYDEGVGFASDDCGCAYKTDTERTNGEASIAYTNSVVSEETRRYLRALPRHLSVELVVRQEPMAPTGDPYRILMVHGSPRRVNEYLFEDRPEESMLRLAAGSDVLLFGHTHRPYHRVLAEAVDGQTRYRHAVNTGSVGKPKDGDPRACYVLLTVKDRPSPADREAIRVEHIRVEYDVERAARAVEESPLPDAFAGALREAR
jgi:predicted phosphodiesterase